MTTDSERHKTDKNWYAFKIYFNKTQQIEESLTNRGIEVFVPKETIIKVRGGVKKKILKPLISGLLFCRTEKTEILKLQKELTGKAYIYRNLSGKPAIISEHEMDVFRLVTTSGDQGLEILDEEKYSYNVGSKVRVKEGPLKGAEGYIRRIKGNNRLIVSVSGVCAVATSYIPRCFLEIIEE